MPGCPADVYSSIKGLRHLDIVQATRDGRAARPAHVQIVLSDTCNQACVGCAYRQPGYTSSVWFGQRLADGSVNYNPRRMLSREKAIEILDDLREMGTRAVQYTGGGEPTVHPAFEEICDATADRGIEYAVVTNGVQVARRRMARVLCNAAWVRVSLDAGSARTYKITRRVPDSHFESACMAVGMAADMKAKSVAGCTIGVGFVVGPENWHEILMATALARELGADNIRFSARFSAEGADLFSGFYGEASDLCRRAEEMAGDGFQVFNRFSDRLDDLRAQSPDYDVCAYQYMTTYIGADQRVYRCCGTAYNPRGFLGSLEKMRFRDLWLSRTRMDMMARFKASECVRCQFHTQNKTLGYAMLPEDPTHSNFV